MTDHDFISVSPLKSVKIPLLLDRTAGFVELPLGRSPRRPSPLRGESERPVWTTLPAGSLYLNHKDLPTPWIPIPTRLAYRPNLRPPPQIGISPSANHSVSVNWDISSKERKFILSRQLLVNGNVNFVVGTRFGGIVNRDPKEVPLSQILNHVSQAELQRFENQDFLEEDIREASLPPPKPKGRPVGSKLVDGRLVLGGSSAGSSSEAQKPPARHTRPIVLIPTLSRVSRRDTPFAASPIPSHPTIKVPALNGTPQIAIRVPSFNGPKPGRGRHVAEADVSSESSEDELSDQGPTGRPQYAMVAASGLAPSETSMEEETSREVSIARAPSNEATRSYDRESSPKRRRLDTQLPLRATAPMKHSDVGPYSNPVTGPAVDKSFRQPQPSASLANTDRILSSTLNNHSDSLASLRPASAPIMVTAQDDSWPLEESSFPPGFDRGRYPAQRRKRANKSYNPKPTPVPAPSPVLKSSNHTNRVSPDSPAQSKLEDVEMVDIVDSRDGEAEREALLRQFQSTIGYESRQPSPSPKVPKAYSTPPKPASTPNSPPLSATKASILARDILNKVNSQSQHAQRSPTPSIHVTTPGKSTQTRISLTPHFPRGAKFSSDTLGGSSSIKSYKSESRSSLTKTKPPPPTKIMQSAIKRQRSLEPAGSGKLRRVNTEHTTLTRTAPKTTANSSSKLSQANPNRLTISVSTNSTKLSPEPITNGTSSKYQTKSPISNDITKYFRPKPSPAKAPPQRPSPEDNDSETESEDPLTRASSYDSLNARVPFIQRRSRPHNSNPDSALRQDGIQSENESRGITADPDILGAQSSRNGIAPVQVAHSEAANEADDVEMAAEMSDFINESGLESDSSSADENHTDDNGEMERRPSQQLPNHLHPAIPPPDVRGGIKNGEREVVEISSCSEESYF